MGQRSRRTIPDRSVPLVGKDGRMTEDWYKYFYWHEEEHGGRRYDRLLRSPAGAAAVVNPSGVAGAAGTVTITIDGVDREVVIE